MMNNEVKGNLNVFKFMGSYNAETGTFEPVEADLENEMNELSFMLEDDGTCYINTNKFEYDENTGAFYLLREAD